MIAFACSQCGMRFRVKQEYAGRSSRCPTCKQRLVVPDVTAAAVAVGPTADTPGTLARAGLDPGVTLPPPAAGQPTVREVLSRHSDGGERYRLEGEIARGGMGAVLRAIDHDIRREVAVKYMLDPADRQKQLRFIEEAQITGQLEHPNIVPIHELGIDAQQRLFFAMKMVRGRSLASVIDGLRPSSSETENSFSLSRLLTVLVSVCHGVAYAHSRGVIHRDLKPANIMLGDFGEVYVMDWGLAKVLLPPGYDQPTVLHGAAEALPIPAPVETSRSSEPDLTQDGAVVGTPVYMSPEQASGKVHALDCRSDVYSLGAILYEILTLGPPIEKGGVFASLLHRVINGEILSPEARAPERARAGKIPPELSAIAMKALARDPADRYQSVEDLRRDVELYLEGRAVSARRDTKWEMLVKFIKRNRAFSAATAVGMLLLAVVLVWSSLVNWSARRATERAFVAYQQEQGEKEERTRRAIPAFVETARREAERRRFDSALEQTNVALEYAPDHAEARLLLGQLLIVRKEFSGAVAELQRYREARPEDALARRLVELCSRPDPDSVANLLTIAAVFQQQELPHLADGLLAGHARDSLEARKQLLEVYRKRIASTWPGLEKNLVLDEAGIYRFNASGHLEVSRLDALEGLPITDLAFRNCKGVRDLTPLKGMPLRRLDLYGCHEVNDLSPLAGMPLTWLQVTTHTLRDLSPLANMPLNTLILSGVGKVSDLSPLRGMPLKVLNITGFSLTDLSPLEGMELEEITLPAKLPRALDLTVLRRMSSLQEIRAATRRFTPAEFWRRYDEGEFNK